MMFRELSREQWVGQYRSALKNYGLDDDIVEELVLNEVAEFDAGECECLREDPLDVAREEMFAMRSEA